MALLIGGGGNGSVTIETAPLEFSDAASITLNSGGNYYVSSVTSIVLPQADANAEPIDLARNWESIDAGVSLTLQAGDSIEGLFPDTGSAAVRLTPIAAQSLWVIVQ